MVGSTISHYRILEKLGEGGMGVVYRAEDTRLDRVVALKCLAAHLLDDTEAKTHFLREAKAAAALDHPNVCAVYDVGEEGGQTFLAMSLVEGESLRKKVSQRPLPLDRAIDYAIQTAQGLQAAHAKGVVHRDIKSANLMVAEQGQVKIMDFGLAQLSDQPRLTKTATFLGTPAYMSPEQAQRQPTDARTDIWSLGVVIYEMVSGRLPFEGERDQAVLFAIANHEHEPITALRVGVPMELDRILDKALAKDIRDRYQHVDDLLVDLRRLRAEPTRGASHRSRSRAVRTRKPSRRTAILAAAGGALIASVTTAYFWFAKPDQVNSLAILPFELDGSSDREYLAEGLAEGLIMNLSRSSQLRMLSRDAAFRYEGSDKDARTIGVDLEVRAVLKGRITPRDGDMLISAEIVSASDGSVMWSAQFRRGGGQSAQPRQRDGVCDC